MISSDALFITDAVNLPEQNVKHDFFLTALLCPSPHTLKFNCNMPNK